MFPLVTSSTMNSPNTANIQRRPIANYHPSIWKDRFLLPRAESSQVDDEMEERAEQQQKEVAEHQKKEVKKMLLDDLQNPLEKLKFVDLIQCLGVSYHFENEIEQVLKKVHVAYTNSLSEDNGDGDLETVALLFRLLRQQGYRISCDVFTKFVESDGKFKESLASDARGILNLYEASHMRVHGEIILDEALDFTINHLKKFAVTTPHSSPLFAHEVLCALKRPIRKALPRLKAREYMLIYEQDPLHNTTLLNFSKHDFNLLQKLHQKELNAITRWWKNLDVPTNFPFARDRIVELYFWILGVYFEPHFNVARTIMTKVIAMMSILDDIYDAYGTFEELQEFTAAIQRWDIKTIDNLPEYMKVYYVFLLDLWEDIGSEIGKDENSYHMTFSIEAMKKQAKSYFQEAEWLKERYQPNYKEYMETALESSGYAQLSTISFLGMGAIGTKEVFEWACKGPRIIKASTIICRLMDDIVSHKQREHVASAIKCYIEEYGCSEEEACVEFRRQVADAWKDMNEACLHPLDAPMPILMRVFNLSRVMDLLYKDKDAYTHAEGQTKLLIQSFLVEPLP